MGVPSNCFRYIRRLRWADGLSRPTAGEAGADPAAENRRAPRRGRCTRSLNAGKRCTCNYIRSTIRSSSKCRLSFRQRAVPVSRPPATPSTRTSPPRCSDPFLSCATEETGRDCRCLGEKARCELDRNHSNANWLLDTST